jgi:DNA (cytosine-5)-methyltransferase 1
LRRDSPPSREKGEGVARGVEIGPSGGGFTDVNPTLDSRRKDGPIRNQLAGAVAMCLNAKGGGGRIDAESETLIGVELSNQGSGGNVGWFYGSGVCPTLDTGGSVAGVTHALRADGFDASEDGTGRGTPLVPICWDEEINAHEDISGAIQQAMAVRRLTPEECEALQGFPRGYTNIPGAADGPRYKALGNSFAVPVVAWIGRWIKEAYANN